MNGVTKKLNIQGATTFADGGVATVYLETIRSLVSFGSFYAYARRIVIEIDLNIANASGGNLTFGWQVLYMILKKCQLTLKTAEHLAVDCTLSAGQALWIAEYMRSLRLPEVSANVTINNGANSTLYLKLFIPFFDNRFASGAQEDPMIFVDLFRDASLELTWCGASQFGAGTTISTTLTQFRVTVEIVPRNEVRFPTLLVLREKQQQNLVDDLDRAGVFWLDIVLEPVQAAGNTATTFAQADITSVKLTADGVNVVDSVKAETLIAQFNQEFLAKAEILAQWEAGSVLMLPIMRFSRVSGKKTKQALTKAKPNLELAGGISSPTTSLRVVETFIRPSGREAAARALRQAGITINDPAAELFPKSSSKQPINDSLAAMTLPWKWYPGGKRAMAPAAK